MSETNNAHISIVEYKRDPTYYHSDGNVVFLVGGVLFKVYALLILPADSISPTTKNTGQRYPLGAEDLPMTLTDSSDACPIVLSDITASQFRNYLLALLGRIYDPEYCSLFTGNKNRKKHTRGLLVRFLDIADVSHRFGMSKLKTWAFSQLESVLKSMDELAESIWDKDTILRLHACARSSGRANFASLAANFIQYFISVSAVPEGEDTTNKHVSLNLDTCVQLFKDPNLLDNDPALFGCAFASILALGHRSDTWSTGVTGSQRAMLYAAQVQLTTPNKDSRRRKNASPNYFPDKIFFTCNRCFGEFRSSWHSSFGKYRELKSASSFQGLTALAQLPQYRRLFSTKFTPHEPGATPKSFNCTVGFLTGRAKDRIFYSAPICRLANIYGDTQAGVGETLQCTGPEWPIGYLDDHIQLVYQDLAKLYRGIASEF